jgi:hypothetical protein
MNKVQKGIMSMIRCHSESMYRVTLYSMSGLGGGGVMVLMLKGTWTIRSQLSILFLVMSKCLRRSVQRLSDRVVLKGGLHLGRVMEISDKLMLIMHQSGIIRLQV